MYDKHLLRGAPKKVVANGCKPCIPTVDLGGATAVFPDLEAQLKARATRALEHRFNVFGIDAAFGNGIDWHLDPKTARRWPLDFWGDIDYRDGTKVGGIKFAWELNRFHHLPLLAIAHAITRDPLYRREIFEQLTSWLAANPYPRGIHWISGIELAIRLVNLVYSLTLLGAEELSAGERRILLDFVSLHGRHLDRYPSRYSSCANHAIAEALGLYIAGAAFPGIPQAACWSRQGKSMLEDQLVQQIQPDGGGFEYSVPYSVFVAEHCLLYVLLSRQFGDGPSGRVEARLCAAMELLSSITDSHGNLPLIGDGDDGCVLRLLDEPHLNHLSLLNAGAILFNRPHWLSHGAAYDLKTYCLLGADSHARWRHLRDAAPEGGIRIHHFTDTGWIVVRDGSREALLVGNCSPLGLPPLAGHGHADALSFWLSVGGRPILVDPGTYLYHDGGMWRRYFRSTAAHNTIRVDGQDQAPMASDFMFGRFYDVHEASVEQSNGAVVWSAWHDGYRRLSDPVVHKRLVVYHKEQGRITIEDSLRCEGRHDIECFFHFHPDCRVSLAHHVVAARSGEVQVTLHMDGTWDSYHVARGQIDPVAGWYSPRFNEKAESSTIVCHKSIERGTTFRTTILLGPA